MNNDLISRSALAKDYRSQFESVYKYIRDTVNPSDFYIERRAAYDKKLMKMEMEAFFEYLQSRPAVDAVEVVRCKDCEEYIPWDDGKICGIVGSYFGNTKPNDFCSRGKKLMRR